jgi:hypothetical protein
MKSGKCMVTVLIHAERVDETAFNKKEENVNSKTYVENKVALFQTTSGKQRTQI